MPRQRTNANIKAVCVTQELPKDNKYLGIWLDHCINLKRPSAIVKRMGHKQQYSVWRTIDEEELNHFQGLQDLDQLRDFEVIREFKDFESIVRG